MIQWLRRYGVDERFILFVVGTMVTGIIVGGLIAGLVSFVTTGDPALLFFVPFITAVGSAFLIPLALLVWILPSAFVFSISMAILKPRLGFQRATRWSALITAFAAACAATYVATNFGRDYDGAGALLFIIGPVSVGIAPWIAGKAYRLSWAGGKKRP